MSTRFQLRLNTRTCVNTGAAVGLTTDVQTYPTHPHGKYYYCYYFEKSFPTQEHRTNAKRHCIPYTLPLYGVWTIAFFSPLLVKTFRFRFSYIFIRILQGTLKCSAVLIVNAATTVSYGMLIRNRETVTISFEISILKFSRKTYW